MMRKLMLGLALAFAGVASASVAAQPESQPSIYGVWLNHAGNVKVRTEPCGQQLCGRVVWASPEALKEAKDAGTDDLVGMQLLRGYKPTPKGEWSGKVYVPDLGRTFDSRIYRINSNQIRISGCVLGGVICKYQTWTKQ